MNGDDRQYLTDEYTVSELPTIAPGTYDATLDGVTSEDHDLYGHRWVWHMKIPEMHPDGGDFDLQIWTPPRISSTGMARDLAKALGADVSKGAKVDLGVLRGCHARLIVTLDDEKGRNRVKGVMPASVTPAMETSAATVDPDFAAWQTEQAAKKAAVQAANAEEPPMPEPPGGEATR